MSRREKRMVRVSVTLDVDVARWCKAHGATPETLTPAVRAYVHDLVASSYRVRDGQASMREEPGAAPHTTADVAIPRMSLQDFWDELRREYAESSARRGSEGGGSRVTQRARTAGMIEAYACLVGLDHAGVTGALHRGMEKAPAWPDEVRGGEAHE